jgi:predicted molibdopterin-dependent oxidoreductase YjgC
VSRIAIEVNGQQVEAGVGETVALAMLKAGIGFDGELSGRGLFCGMGSCFECHSEVDGEAHVRTCMVTVRQGMRVRTHDGQAT